MPLKLRELREKNDYMQKEVAAVLQITRPQYSNYENGKHELPIRHLRTLCLLYKVSADYILDLPRGLKYPNL